MNLEREIAKEAAEERFREANRRYCRRVLPLIEKAENDGLTPEEQAATEAAWEESGIGEAIRNLVEGYRS